MQSILFNSSKIQFLKGCFYCFTLFVIFLWPFAASFSRETLNLLKEHDENSILSVLNEEVPSCLSNQSLYYQRAPDNLVALVNKEWIFRFPRSLESLPVIKHEKLLLEQISSSITMQIPHFDYIGYHTAFVGYRKIEGESLDEEKYSTLDERERQRLAESLALFLTRLHQAISIRPADKMGI